MKSPHYQTTLTGISSLLPPSLHWCLLLAASNSASHSSGPSGRSGRVVLGNPVAKLKVQAGHIHYLLYLIYKYRYLMSYIILNFWHYHESLVNEDHIRSWMQFLNPKIQLQPWNRLYSSHRRCRGLRCPSSFRSCRSPIVFIVAGQRQKYRGPSGFLNLGPDCKGMRWHSSVLLDSTGLVSLRCVFPGFPGSCWAVQPCGRSDFATRCGIDTT